MPRIFSTAIQGEIDKQFTGEPMKFIEVEWVDGSPIAYADTKLNDEEYPFPYVVSIGQFDSTQTVSGGSDSQETTIILNDTDGSIREIIDSQDAHLNAVRVYLTFQGLPIEEKALLFEGVINSPYVWDEGGRTLTFSVLSQIESVEAGFTMEDGDFPFIEPSDRNKPWPLVFGSVCNMEAVQVRGTRKGFLAEGVGVKDPTIEERLCQAKHLQCSIVEGATSSDGGVNAGGGGTSGSSGFTNVRSGKPDQQCIERRFNKICEIIFEKEQQEQYVKSQFELGNVDDFPQNETVTIQINEVKFEGILSGTTFTVGQVIHPDPKDNPPCVEIPPVGWGYRWGPDDDTDPITIGDCESRGDRFNQEITGGGAESWAYFNTFERSKFIWLPPGSEVLLADEAEVINIVSLLPGTVNQVASYRNFSDTSLLTSLPTDLYEVKTTDYGGYDVVEVWLNAPLSTVTSDDTSATWDDEIFVSFTSSIGPNPADIIQWLVEEYTDLTVDATSFASVKSSLTNYPSNFFRKSRDRVLDLIRDIAFQARCGVFIRDNVVYLVYLSKEPTSVKTLTEDDILPNSFRITHTETENLETRHTISWSEGEAGIFKSDETDLEFVLKHNIPRYGVFEASYDYYTMNIFELVEKSATFWMIRNSNTWKHIEFETPLVHLNLDVFDAVTINLTQFPTTKCIIEESRFNLDSNTITFKCWTPIRSGEDSEYLWAWPALQDQFAIHPLPENSGDAGDGFDPQVIPPEDHPLFGAYDPDTAVLNTDGDKHPSDLDDTLPTLECKIATGAEISDDIEPEFDPFEPLAEENFQDKLAGIDAPGRDGGSTDDAEESNACGDVGPGNDGCVYEVFAYYVSPAAVTTVQNPGQNCKKAGPCGPENNGVVCYGPEWGFCHSFGTLWAAQQFRLNFVAQVTQLRENCGYNTGVIAPLMPGPITAIPSDSGLPGAECDDPSTDTGSPDDPGADAGETQKPKCGTGDCENAPSV